MHPHPYRTRLTTPPSPSPYRAPEGPLASSSSYSGATTPMPPEREGSITPKSSEGHGASTQADITAWMEQELAKVHAIQAEQDALEEAEAQRAFAAYLRPEAEIYERPAHRPAPRPPTPGPRAVRPNPPTTRWAPLESLPPLPRAPLSASDPAHPPLLEMQPAPGPPPERPRVRRVLPQGPQPVLTRAARAHARAWGVMLDLPHTQMPDTHSQLAWTADGTTRYYTYAGADGVTQVALFMTAAHLQERIVAMTAPPNII